MPWAFLIRLLSGFLFWRLLGNRRRSAAQRAFGAATGRNPDVARRVREAREAASLLSRLALTAGFGLAASLAIAAGTTTVVLSPRWLGGVLLAVGAFFVVLMVREAISARRLVTVRRLRRRDARLKSEF